MRPLSRGNLEFGSAVIELLIPHRRPFLMVDTVEHFSGTPRPGIRASRHVSMNETYFDGHFPGMPLWPGALTMEGLGQSAVLLQTLVRLEGLARARGEEPESVLEALRNLDRGFRLHPGYRADGVEALRTELRSAPGSLAVGAAVEMKFLKPVLPGCRLDYAVELTDKIGDQMRFSAEASVEGEPVARGWITGAILPRPEMPSGS
jgi:3-hydroxyacyl-[acyl-carrier-protein] dehydratase